jgi:integrase
VEPDDRPGASRCARRRDRIASPAEAARLIGALPESDRALWATAIYAGLRRGELMALEWGDVDFGAGVLRVERFYDPTLGVTTAPNSAAGIRKVPIAVVLREYLIPHRLRSGRSDGLVFGTSADAPRRRAATVWKAAGLGPIGLHEARHTFASLMTAAGVNAKAQ